jgi:hypothetical protein
MNGPNCLTQRQKADGYVLTCVGLGRVSQFRSMGFVIQVVPGGAGDSPSYRVVLG